MIVPEPRPADPEPRPPFQFTLRTLLLLFVVLGSSLAVFGGWGIVVSALVVGLAIYIRYVQSLPSPGQCFLLLVVLLGALLALLTPVVETARESSLRLQCAVNLKQIAAALLAYHQAHGSFPPAYIADKSGKPMHSWRALILPFLDSNPIAGAYDFSEPWDGPNNKKLLALRHPFYVCPGAADARTPSASQTSYVAVVGPGTAWAGEKSRKAGDFGGADGDTILVVELINSGIAWSEPKDLSLDSLGDRGRPTPASLFCRAITVRPRISFSPMTARAAVASTWRWPMVTCGTCRWAGYRRNVCGTSSKSVVVKTRRLTGREGCSSRSASVSGTRTGPTSPPSSCGCCRPARCWSGRCGAGKRRQSDQHSS